MSEHPEELVLLPVRGQQRFFLLAPLGHVDARARHRSGPAVRTQHGLALVEQPADRTVRPDDAELLLEIGSLFGAPPAGVDDPLAIVRVHHLEELGERSRGSAGCETEQSIQVLVGVEHVRHDVPAERPGDRGIQRGAETRPALGELRLRHLAVVDVGARAVPANDGARVVPERQRAAQIPAIVVSARELEAILHLEGRALPDRLHPQVVRRLTVLRM